MSLLAMGIGVGIAVGPMLAGVMAIYAFELPILVGGVLSLLGALKVGRYVRGTVNGGAVP